jgi:NADH dehydrogenase
MSTESRKVKRPKVVILGAGFGGLTLARKIAKRADVTVVDRHNYQTFLPLLYQVASAGLAADHIAHPIRGALRGLGVQFRMGSPIAIDSQRYTVKLDSSELLEYDQLVVALGSETTDFGIEGVSENALGMKSVHEALRIRGEVMRRFEDLCRVDDGSTLDIVIVGGGPTGVEMAGALAELARGPLRRDHEGASNRIAISLIEAGDRLLPSFHSRLSERTKRDLTGLGVKVLVNTKVAQVHADRISLVDGTEIPSLVTIWAAGVRGESTAERLRLPIVRGRIKTERTLRVEGYQNIYAIGDVAGVETEDGRLLPMVAPVAMQQARFLATQLFEEDSQREFKYLDKGSMATIGRHKAVVEAKGLRMAGAPAWFAWLWLHLFYLLGGRNKVGTMADWTWNYLTFDRGNRHIMDGAEL